MPHSLPAPSRHQPQTCAASSYSAAGGCLLVTRWSPCSLTIAYSLFTFGRHWSSTAKPIQTPHSRHQRVALLAAVELLMRATGGCETHSIRLEELARQLTMHAKHQEAVNLRDGYGEQPQSQPLMPISNSFNSNSVKRVPGALDGNSKRKARQKCSSARRTAACPADAALLPAASNKKKKLTHQQQLAADGGDAAAAKWLSQLPDDVKGSWEPGPQRWWRADGPRRDCRLVCLLHIPCRGRMCNRRPV